MHYNITPFRRIKEHNLFSMLASNLFPPGLNIYINKCTKVILKTLLRLVNGVWNSGAPEYTIFQFKVAYIILFDLLENKLLFFIFSKPTLPFCPRLLTVTKLYLEVYASLKLTIFDDVLVNTVKHI